jgi:nitroreductase
MSDPTFDHVIRTRRTARAYRADPVPEALLNELVELATLAPSGMNGQPWRFSIVTNRDALKQVNVKVKQGLSAMLPGLPALQQYESVLLSEEYDIFYGAPALIVVQCPQGNQLGVMDSLLAAENLILAAHAKGLGSCFMGFLLMAQGAEGVAAAVGMREGYQMVAPIVVGYSDAIPQTPPERNAPEITWIR